MAQKEWVKQIFQVVLVVNDVNETLENWKRDVEFDKNSISCGMTETNKYAQFDFGGVDLKLVEPLNKDGDDYYARTLREKGQGFSHVSIVSDDYEKILGHFNELGFKQSFEETSDDITMKLFDFRDEIGMSVGVYEEMFGPCAR